ncbi:DNA-binding transcriptional regulator, MarR family [Ruminococcaceae bacterium FB2012]|nr:DNA-binding transcriptional regulator, MarR family [Ruminococcaceae bacterium FB2012]
MNEKARKECVNAMFELYPRARKMMYESFDKLEDDLTRTQQIILLALAVKDNLSMSQLASKICTSNEQATRAVTQLVDKGLVNRMQNKTNRRVVNITLTQKAKDHLDAAKKAALAEGASKAAQLSDEDLQAVSTALRTILDVVSKIDTGDVIY